MRAWLFLSLGTGFAMAQETLTIRTLPRVTATACEPLRLGLQMGLPDGEADPLSAECFSEASLDAAVQALANTPAGRVTVRVIRDADTGRRVYVVANGEEHPDGMTVRTSTLRQGVGHTVRVTCQRVKGSGKLRFGFLPADGRANEETQKKVSLKNDTEAQKTFTVKPSRDGVYQCAFQIEPGSEMAFSGFSLMPDDADAGWNREVLEALRKSGPNVLRWPAEKNLAFYNWYDGVGPLEMRRSVPLSSQMAGGQAFGTVEFVSFCRTIGAEPLFRVPLFFSGGDDARVADRQAGVQLAADWVAYCNATNDRPLAVLRARHGYKEALGVKRWELSEGSSGSLDVASLAETCQAYAAGMKAEDPSIRVGVALAVPANVARVLRLAGEALDFVSCGTPEAYEAVQSYNREHGARLSVADTRLSPLRDRYVARVMRRLESEGAAADRAYFGEWFDVLGVACAGLEQWWHNEAGLICTPFYPEQVLNRVPYARNMLNGAGLMVAVVNRFPALTPLALEGMTETADAPFKVYAAWTEDPTALVVFVCNPGTVTRRIRLDLTPLKRSFAFWLSDQLEANLTPPRTETTVPIIHRQKAGAALTQVVLCESPPASFTRLVVKE